MIPYYRWGFTVRVLLKALIPYNRRVSKVRVLLRALIPYIRWSSCAWVLLAACVSTPDHFYTLSTLPDGERRVSTAPAFHVLLNVTIPLLVDRSEMIVDTAANGILVLDHERWAGPLSDQVSQTLARDIEKRRPDVLVGGRTFDQASSLPVSMRVDIVRMSVRRGGRARLEAQWRIVDPTAGSDQIGSDVFEAPVTGSDYAALATAYSETLSELAQALAGRVRSGSPPQP